MNPLFLLSFYTFLPPRPMSYGRQVRRFKRLDAAEAVCRAVERCCGDCLFGDLLAVWRGARKASEADE